MWYFSALKLCNLFWFLFSFYRLFRICTFVFFFIKKDPQIECIFRLTKPDAAPANTPMFSQIVTHMLTLLHMRSQPHILVGVTHALDTQCLSHTCRPILTSDRWATQAPPAHWASGQILSLHPSRAPALLTVDTWHCLAHPQHSQNHTTTSQGAGHSPSCCTPRTGPSMYPASAPQRCTHCHLSTKAPQPTEHPGISLETSSLPDGSWH